MRATAGQVLGVLRALAALVDAGVAAVLSAVTVAGLYIDSFERVWETATPLDEG